MPKKSTGLWNRGPLKDVNDSKLILNVLKVLCGWSSGYSNSLFFGAVLGSNPIIAELFLFTIHYQDYQKLLITNTPGACGEYYREPGVTLKHFQTQ